MDRKVAEQVKILIAENKLEEALTLLISSLKESNDKKLNTLILLKGKLALLKEQELAGLLDFEDLTREKAKIGHSLLESISSGMAGDMPSGTFVSAGPSSSFLKKILIIGGAMIVIIMGVAVYISSLKDKGHTLANTSESEENPALSEKNLLPAQIAGQYHFTTGLPIDHPFDIGDISYSIKSANLEKYADPTPGHPGKVKLTVGSQLIGKRKGTGGLSWREERVRVLVDGVPYAPISQGVNGGWIALDSNEKDLLEFAFDDNGHEYFLEFHYEDQVHRFPFSFSKK